MKYLCFFALCLLVAACGAPSFSTENLVGSWEVSSIQFVNVDLPEEYIAEAEKNDPRTIVHIYDDGRFVTKVGSTGDVTTGNWEVRADQKQWVITADNQHPGANSTDTLFVRDFDGDSFATTSYIGIDGASGRIEMTYQRMKK